MSYLGGFQNMYKVKKTKVFISFDYDHDQDLKILFAGQAQHDDTPFEIADISVKDELTGDWKAKVRRKIKSAEQVVVICGEYTDSASGVNAEIRIAQEESIPYFLIWGRKDKTCKKPTAASENDKIYSWTWPNVKTLLDGGR
jgi:hypothetical protein